MKNSVHHRHHHPARIARHQRGEHRRQRQRGQEGGARRTRAAAWSRPRPTAARAPAAPRNTRPARRRSRRTTARPPRHSPAWTRPRIGVRMARHADCQRSARTVSDALQHRQRAAAARGTLQPLGARRTPRAFALAPAASFAASPATQRLATCTTTSSSAPAPPAACWPTACPKTPTSRCCCWKPARATGIPSSTCPPAWPSWSTTRA